MSIFICIFSCLWQILIHHPLIQPYLKLVWFKLLSFVRTLDITIILLTVGLKMQLQGVFASMNTHANACKLYIRCYDLFILIFTGTKYPASILGYTKRTSWIPIETLSPPTRATPGIGPVWSLRRLGKTERM